MCRLSKFLFLLEVILKYDFAFVKDGHLIEERKFLFTDKSNKVV